MNTVEQGRIGEIKSAAHLLSMGFEVYIPYGGNASCDLIVISPTEALFRVEVKSVKSRNKSGSYTVILKQTRPNRTGNKVKKFNASQADLLAVYVFPEDRVYLFETVKLDGKSVYTFTTTHGLLSVGKL